MATEKILNEQLIKFAEYLKVPITKQTLALYSEKLINISDEIFNNIMKHLYLNWKYKHFPLVADIINACRAVKPTVNNYTPEKRDNNAIDPLNDNRKNGQFKFLQVGYKAMDIITKQVLQPVYGQDYMSGYNYTEKRDKMNDFYHSKMVAGEVFDIANEKWIKKNERVKDKKYFHPQEFGF